MDQATWDQQRVAQQFELPFMELIYQAYRVYRQHFDPTQMELCTLMSIKSGACPEDCGYCAQSGHYNTGLEKEKLLDLDAVLVAAKQAKANGSHRFCMGAAWRSPPKKDMPKVVEIIKGVKALGLETCVTLGMLDADQAAECKQAGLDFYNHNLDTSPEFYEQIISTHTYQDRLDTLENVRQAGIKVCCGGILGMGESREDRVQLLLQLYNLSHPPESITINRLIRIPGTKLAVGEPIDDFEFMRTIAVARCMFPKSALRLSAGRAQMSDEVQTLCFMAGANSIFYGEKLLTTNNASEKHDQALLQKLGMSYKSHAECYAD